MPWVVYILRCSDGTLYTGITNDLTRRVAAHECGRGAKYTRGRGPFVVVYHQEYPDRSSASKREREIKAMEKSSKLALLAGHEVA